MADRLGNDRDPESLRRQLAAMRESLRLIEERKAQFVQETDVPLQLVKEERRLRERIAELERKAGALPSAAPQPAEDRAANLTPERADTARPGTDERTQAQDRSNRWRISPLFRWFLGGVIVSGLAVLVWFGWLRCLIAYRITEAAVALVVFLASGAAAALTFLVSPGMRKTLLSLYGGVATVLFLGVVAALASPPPPGEACFPTPTPTATATHTATPTPTPTLAATPTTTPTNTPTATSTMVVVYVPAGTFQMGSDDADSDEKPVHQVTLDSFWIDRTEVTNAQYARCVEAGRCNTPAESKSYTRNSYYGNGEFADYPVIYVSWEHAKTYCEWAGGRLPTEAEWEYAARGSQHLVYPWGNEFDGRRLNYCDKNCEFDWADKDVDDGYADTAPAGSYPEGASWVGALGMAGNVWEWVADWYGTYLSNPQVNPTGPTNGDFHVLRGGSWGSIAANMRAAYRDHYTPDNRYDSIGFRCVGAAPGE